MPVIFMLASPNLSASYTRAYVNRATPE
jgi:hypothetical protein